MGNIGISQEVHTSVFHWSQAKIGKYASENGEANGVRHYKDLDVKDSRVRDWRDAYLKEVGILTAKSG